MRFSWLQGRSRVFLMLSLVAIGLSTGSCRRGGGGGGGGNPPPGEEPGPGEDEKPPEGDPTAAWGEISAEEAVSIIDGQAAEIEGAAAAAVDGSAARKLTESVTNPPEGGGASIEDDAGLSLAAGPQGGCEQTKDGNAADSDGDWAAVDLTQTYKCDWQGDSWAHKSEGSWSVKDHDDSDPRAGARFEVGANTYSGRYQHEGKEETYQGISAGYGDFKRAKDGTSTYDTKWAYGYQRNGEAPRGYLYIFLSTFIPDAGHSDVSRKGTIQMAGYYRHEGKKTVILKTTATDLVLDDKVCLDGSFKSGVMVFEDGKARKVTMTYKDCKRTIAMENIDLTDKTKKQEADKNEDLVSCNIFNQYGEEDDNGKGSDESEAEYKLGVCIAVDIKAKGVKGDTREERIEFLKDVCGRRSYPPWHISEAVVGRGCARPEKGWACLGERHYVGDEKSGEGPENFVRSAMFYYRPVVEQYAEDTKGYCEYGQDWYRRQEIEKKGGKLEKRADFVKFE